MARNRQGQKNSSLFEVPEQRDGGHDSTGDGDSVGVFGGPTHDSRVLGDPGNNSGLFDVPDRAPGDMPGLFDRPGRGAASGRRLSANPTNGNGMSIGLFAKLRRASRP